MQIKHEVHSLAFIRHIVRRGIENMARDCVNDKQICFWHSQMTEQMRIENSTILYLYLIRW